jgi:hypothetical protein
MNIVVLAAVGLLVLFGLVAVGLGHKRWSWGTVVAAFLVLVSATAYLYLAARVAARDRGWMRALQRYETDIASVRDALQPNRRGGFTPIEGQLSLAALETERDRWQRALSRVETWRSAGWENASFAPPKDAASTGLIDLPADGNDAESAPLQPGAHVFVFDMAKLEDGGRYLGEFRVTEVKYDEGSKRWTLAVGHATARDASDEEALAGRHDAVAVFEDLPVDRWLAFYRTKEAAEATPPAADVMPEPVKAPLDKVEAALKPDGDVGRLVDAFIESFKTHEEVVPEDEWATVTAGVEQGTVLPGTYWGEVEFTAPHTFAPTAAGDAEPEESDGIKRDYEAGELAELDLATALDLQKGGKARLMKLIRRRPLSDASARLNGAPIVPGAGGGQGIRADGLASLTERLRAEVAGLARAEQQLESSLQNANTGVTQANDVAGQLRDDLASWKRDVTEAARLVAAFEQQLRQATAARTDAERQVVDLGRDLTAIVARLTAEIDRVAPPPTPR